MLNRLRLLLCKPRKVRKPRRPTNPAGAAKTLEYEFNSLGDALGEYRRHKPPPGAKSTPLSNATLEAFLLHARNLRGFFRGTSDRDDILAIDWLTAPTAFPMPVFDRESRAIHKLLAHPSYSRGKLLKLHNGWLPDTIYEELASSRRQFLDQLAVDSPELRKLFPH